jgi:hypothetical protein
MKTITNRILHLALIIGLSAVLVGVFAQKKPVPFKQGMTLGPGKSATMTVTGPVVTDGMYFQLCYSGFIDDKIDDPNFKERDGKEWMQWFKKWYIIYEKTGQDKNLPVFYQWIKKKRLAELESKKAKTSN